MDKIVEVHDGIKRFALTISQQPLGLAYHRPEHWARPTECFANVLQKVKRKGGRICFGWTFNYRINPQLGGYLFATHHAVWYAPAGNLIDVTPFHADAKHHPITQEGHVLLQVDDGAEPVIRGNLIGPLPLQFFALSHDEALIRYVEKMRRDEEERCLPRTTPAERANNPLAR